MSYCSREDVVDITATSLNDDIPGQQTIERIITASDRKINRLLKQNGLSAPTSTPDDLKDASTYFSASTILNRHMIDGTLPAQYKADGLSEHTDVTSVIKNYEAEAMSAVQLYIEDTVDGADFSTFRVIGKLGERVGETDTMTESEEDET